MITPRENPSRWTMVFRYTTLSILTFYILIWLIVFFSEQGFVTCSTGISLRGIEKEKPFDSLSVIRSKGFVIVEKVDSNSIAEKAGVFIGDTIVTVDGTQLKDKPQLFYKIWTKSPYGDTLNIGLIKNGTQENRVLVLDKKEGILSYLTYNFQVLFWILSFVVGGLIGWMRTRDSIAFLCSVFFLCLGFKEEVYYSLLPYWAIVIVITLNSITAAIGLPLGLRLFSIFPNPSRFGKVLWRWQWVAFLLFSLNAFIPYTKNLSVLLEWSIIIPLTQQVAQMFEPVGAALFVALLLLIIPLYLSQRKATRDRPQARLKIIEFSILFWGLSALAALVFALIGSMLLKSLDDIPRPISVVLLTIFIFPFLISMLAIPISFAYTILTRKIFGIRFIVRKGLRYLLLSKGALLVEGIIVFFIVIQILSYAGTEFLNSPTAVGGVAVASTLAVIAVVGRVNRKLMPVIDRRFFREALDVRKLLMDLNEQLSELREREKILQLTASTVLKALHPLRVVFLLKEEKAKHFRCVLVQEHEAKQAPSGKTNGLTRHSEFISESQSQPLASDEMPKQVRHDDVNYLKSNDSIIRQLEEKKSYVTIYPEKLDPEVEGDKRLLDLNCELFIGVQGSAGLVGIMALGGKLSEEPFSKEDRDLLTTVARQMGLSLENAELLEVAKREAEQSRDLEIARSVQQNLFPKQLPVVAGWEFAGICNPAKAVGGDYYDIFEAVPGKVVVALGDVSGKGLGASFVMSGVHSTIRTNAEKSFDNPVGLINELNKYLLGSTSKNIFVTLFLGIIDLESGRMQYVNCGHPPAFVVRKENGEIEKLTRTGLALGMMNTIQFTQGSSTLKAGDSLIVYSDGITEAMNEKEEFFDEERLVKVVNTASKLEAASMMEEIMKSVNKFAGTHEQADDISVIIAQRQKSISS